MRRRDILILLGVVITPLGAAARKSWRIAFFKFAALGE
jgi:hypothetical protein